MDTADDKIRKIHQELDRLLEIKQSGDSAVRIDEVLSYMIKQLVTTRRSVDYVKQLNLLQKIAGQLVEVRDFDQLAIDILEGANTLIPFTDGSIGFVEDNIVKFPYAIGESAETVMAFEIEVGKGLTGTVVKTKKPIRIGDTRKDPRYREQIGSTRSELDVPILYQNECIGVINIESTQVEAFSEEHEQLLTALANQAAIAYRNTQHFNRMDALTNIAQQLSSTLNFDLVIEQILETISELINSPEVSVGIINKETNKLEFIKARGPSRDEVLQFVPDIKKGLTGLAVRTGKSIRVGDVTNDPNYQDQIGDTKSELDVPLRYGDEVIGVLNAESPNFDAFSKDDEDILVAVASHATLAIKNARLYQEIEAELEERINRQEAAERMALIGDVAGNLVHRMNNDVGAIRVRADQIATGSNNKSIQDKALKIKGLANKVLGQFREFRERYKDVESTPLSINPILLDVIREVPIPKEVKVTDRLAENLSDTFAAEVRLKEVFRNLVANAVEAMENGGELIINSEQKDKMLIVRVQDTGSGISDQDKPHVFDLGFSTKKEGKGLGYGLFWVRTYLNRIGGRIEVEDTKTGIGTTFIVTLPAYK